MGAPSPAGPRVAIADDQGLPGRPAAAANPLVQRAARQGTLSEREG